ncbi:MAG: flagellar hook-length control protein FliK [Phycisphaerae bacterium]|nr:flagellar hook-length control protein FliK [Phycisphaerae bacterium]
MQMNWLSLAASAQTALASGACSPWLVGSTTLTHQTSATLVDSGHDSEDDDTDGLTSAPLAASNAAINADSIVRSELSMDPGSRACQRQENRAAGRADGAAHAAEFRQALTEATQSETDTARASVKPAAAAPTTGSSSQDAAQTDTAPAAAESEADGRPNAARGTVAQNTSATPPTTTAATPAAENAAKATVSVPQALTSTDALASLTRIPTAAPAVSEISAAANATTGSTTNSSSSTGAAKTSGDTQAVSGIRAATRSAERAASTTKTSSTDTASRKDETTTERIVRFVRMHIGKENSRATMRLDPPALGKIRVDVQQQQNVVTLRIDTQNDVAHRLLSNDLDELRHSLEAAGIRVERLEVRPPEAADARTEFGLPHQTDPGQDGQNGSAQSSAEHSNEGRESHQTASYLDAETADLDDRLPNVTTTESLVNCLA